MPGTPSQANPRPPVEQPQRMDVDVRPSRAVPDAIQVDEPRPSVQQKTFDLAGQPSGSSSSRSNPSSSSSISGGSTTSTTTPTRRRPPSSIPNFPSAHEHRDSQATPFSPSPTSSPAQASPFRSPFATPPPPPARTPFLPIPQGGAASPWHSLAATSGAPTPSLDGPSTSRGSPQLGYPFEQLNIGGSWSGANLGGPKPEPIDGMPGFQLDGSTLPPSGAAASGNGVIPRISPSLDAILARRRASLPKNTGLGLKSPSPLASSSSSPAPSGSRLQPISSSALAAIADRPTTLVLDVRAPSSYAAAHLPSAHSLPIPSTLLRRPAFTIAKLLPMLDPRGQADVAKWREMKDIVLVDQDSHAVAEGNILQGLAGKFEREGFEGKIWFVKGGHQALQASGDNAVVSDDDDNTAPSSARNTTLLPPGGLSRSAFQQGSVGTGRRPLGTAMPETPGFSLRADPFVLARVARLDPPRSPAMRSRDASAARLQPANPFFDNIRQNLELSHGGITERIPLALPESVTERANELPTFLRSLVEMPEKDSMDKLADQFYQIELGEQRRLQSVMSWHTQGSGALLPDGAGRGVGRTGAGGASEQVEKDADEVDRLVEWGGGAHRTKYFPFSITAGVERGAKNRYKNIWPYDFSRVRLASPTDDDSDYINASFIQPRGTTRRYIATQGPLDATYRDFWTLVWEQNVLVIVMLTKQFEGGLIKCGNYWSSGAYGNIRLELVLQAGGEDKAEGATTGFDFGQAATAKEPTPVEHNIKRVFMLSNTNHPSAPPRRITQIQCVSWPDFDVPDSPDVIVDLIKDVGAAVDATLPAHAEADTADDRNETAPVLVHCSAGVGRTGSFILVDAMLDGLRRERNAISGTRKTPKRPVHAEPVPPAYHLRHHSSGGSGDSIASKNSSGSSLARAVSQLRSNDEYPNQSSNNLSAVFSESPRNAADVTRPPNASPMEIDAQPTGWPDSANHRFDYSNSEDGTEQRRPSLVSTHTSSERQSDESIPRDLDHPVPITASDMRHRTPSPLSDMSEPIAEVLEGMRVQRMSLVQSLRQYLFVHRAIIHNYLAMLDEEKGAGRGGALAGAQPALPDQQDAGADADDARARSLSAPSDETAASRTSRASTAPLSASTAPTSVSGASDTSLAAHASAPAGTGAAAGAAGSSLDDDGHIKRKPSPTELHPELPVDKAVSLSKRASFKKMRPGPFEGGIPGGTGAANLGAPTIKSPTKKRSDRSDKSA
ncbi:phosphotyrosine-specific ptp2-like protein [Cryptotrichosporon argae]